MLLQVKLACSNNIAHKAKLLVRRGGGVGGLKNHNLHTTHTNYQCIYLLYRYKWLKRCTLIQLRRPATGHTKSPVTCSCIVTNPFVGHQCIDAVRAECIHIECLIAILRQNAYMHEQLTNECVERKYLNECIPFGYVTCGADALVELAVVAIFYSFR